MVPWWDNASFSTSGAGDLVVRYGSAPSPPFQICFPASGTRRVAPCVPLLRQETTHLALSLCLTKLVCFVCQQLSAAPNIPGKGMKCAAVGFEWANICSSVLCMLTASTTCIYSFAGPEGSDVLINPDWRHSTGHGWALMFCLSFSSQLPLLAQTYHV